MTHNDACAIVQLHLSALGCQTSRHFVGMVTTEGDGRRKIGTPGHADISGTTGDGRAIAVEVKVGKDKPKPNQAAWAKAWTGRFALYAVCRPDRDGWREQLADLVAP